MIHLLFIEIMEQNELIRRTGGTHKTIEFIPQTVHKKENVKYKRTEQLYYISSDSL